ncbi:hypothetical protein C1146_14660 [Clostridium botulinum]|nr:hypothetical protein C1146_14660 [Clostridium botulinum]
MHADIKINLAKTIPRNYKAIEIPRHTAETNNHAPADIIIHSQIKILFISLPKLKNYSGGP